MAGINQARYAVIIHRAAGKAAVPVRLVPTAGKQRDGLVLPANHVLAGGVSPVHRSPFRLIGIMLIERVVAPRW
ncbi:hypothetical protein AU490_04695 [Lonsdalea populi]|uniref:Uncharacterized protein n=2 Tax=Lonsdalea TaxID=1082702 RepID=A0ACD1J9B7_9GAMM|nr:hypothetical protein AU508_05155 [Lonsdalea populi]RAT11354.1 hypothetical protein AU485_14590 [Lonsdalea quercina]OSN00823.1 hypothetical protein AU499_09705 [Lonsdalea populi]RAT17163.1 hypothetical protein AU486_05735 [Lonsdalea quercina]RAT26802.1 hypothetical protein AU488_03090 [Lonsdalea populi]